MPRTPARSRIRPRGFRQEKPIFVIATEGEVTERIYFEKIKEKYRDKYTIYILPTNRGSNSAPKHVIQRLEDFIRRKVSTRRKKDEFWAVIDDDNRGEKQLTDAYDKCQTKRFNLAVSNPCFELWLNYHQDNPTSPKTCTECRKHLRKLLGNYDKNNYDVDKLVENINKALEKCRNLHKDKVEPFPKETGTHVYLLIEKIVENKK